MIRNMEENNKVLSDKELENIVAGNNEECYELLKWCKDHGAYVSLPRSGERCNPKELEIAFRFLKEKLQERGMWHFNMGVTPYTARENHYDFVHLSNNGKQYSLSHREFIDFLNEKFG